MKIKYSRNMNAPVMIAGSELLKNVHISKLKIVMVVDQFGRKMIERSWN